MAVNHPRPGVHQQETAGAIGVFGLPGLKAGLAKEGGLLVPGTATDRHLHPLDVGGSIDLAASPHLREHLHRDVQSVADAFIPAQLPDVIEHGAAGVGVIGDMDGAAGKFPDEPGIHRPEEQLPLPGPLPGAGDCIQNPFQLGGGKIGVHQKAGVLLDVGGKLFIRQQLLADGGGAAALPDDGVADRPPGVPFPNDGGFPLVGDADAGNLLGVDAALGQHLHQHPVLGGVDFHGVVLHPAGMGVVLGKFLLGQPHNVLLLVKEDGPRAGGALVQGDDILLHSLKTPFVHKEKEPGRGNRSAQPHLLHNITYIIVERGGPCQEGGGFLWVPTGKVHDF